MRESPKNTRKTMILGIGLTIISLLVGFSIGRHYKSVEFVSSKSIRENDTDYKFIHPLLALDRPVDLAIDTSGGLSKDMNDLINKDESQNKISAASVYFVNYGSKSNVGFFAINRDDKYAPASLLKVVIMVAFFKEAETESSILNSELTYTPNISNLDDQPFDTATKLVIDKKYTVEDLINRMIIDSDNGAMNLLLSDMTDAYLNKVYLDLGLKGPEINSVYTISVSDYSLFFRILYNATYLSHEYSEKALSILSKATFKDGIVAGLPQGTIVSQKFGEHINTQGTVIDSIELHNCGIVYLPNNPYLICVMTKGKNYDDLAAFIKDVSSLTYKYVSQS